VKLAVRPVAQVSVAVAKSDIIRDASTSVLFPAQTAAVQLLLQVIPISYTPDHRVSFRLVSVNLRY